MSVLLTLVFSCAIFGAVFGSEKTQVVTTKYGKVEGSLASNGLYFEYWGIRYALPIKFRAPEEPPTYSDIYKADNVAVLCPQFPCNDPLAVPSDNEDCLVLNIFTPSHLLNGSLPVIVFLHGGGFGVGTGSPSIYGPQYLVSHGVVAVTLNYRLNAYGFLNLGIPEAPGNAGLKDIRAALRWIKENIHAFGGDPDNVTVLGQGSGGMAALYLTLSESTKGLFHRVICESGPMYSPHSFDKNPLGTASQVAKSLGVLSVDPEELLAVYSETPIMKVEEAISKQMNARSVFVPSVEEPCEGEEAFLTDTPFNILKNGKCHGVPIIIGLNTVEGLTSTLDYYTITSQMDRIKSGDFSCIDQRSMDVPENEKEAFRNTLRETYFSNTDSEETIIGGIINLNSDFSYVGPMSLFADMYANSTGMPVYQYIFNYIGNRNLGRLLTNSSLPATAHGDELFYVFELVRLTLPMSEEDARMVTFMSLMFCNFAKYGTPTPETGNGEWLPYPHHLAIDLEPQYVNALTPERAYFWRDFFFQYGAELS